MIKPAPTRGRELKYGVDAHGVTVAQPAPTRGRELKFDSQQYTMPAAIGPPPHGGVN